MIPSLSFGSQCGSMELLKKHMKLKRDVNQYARQRLQRLHSFDFFELFQNSRRIKLTPFHACHLMQADEPVEIPTGSFDKVKALQDMEKLAAPANSGASSVEAKCAEADDFTSFCQ